MQQSSSATHRLEHWVSVVELQELSSKCPGGQTVQGRQDRLLPSLKVLLWHLDFNS